MNEVKTVRYVGIAEGISFVLLMFIAMPMKYIWDQPLAVKYVGWAHGVLFMLYVGVIFWAMAKEKLEFKWCVYAFLAALLPFGPFVIDGKLKKFQ